jgi:hypothetical protein
LDEDAAQLGLTAALSLRGVDVTTAQREGLIATPDAVHLDWCCRQGRVLCSFNVRDFSFLHRKFVRLGMDHPGLIVAPQQCYSIGEQMRRLLRIIAAKSAEVIRNRIEFLSAWT